MAKKPPVVALLSIHPQYADAILSGEKKVEFRKAGFTKEVTHVVIYATKPIGAIVGVFETDGTIAESPTKLWKAFSHVGGIKRKDFYEYYSGRPSGVAIRIKKAKRLPEPVPLARIQKTHPPQSFNYLSADSLTMVS